MQRRPLKLVGGSIYGRGGLIRRYGFQTRTRRQARQRWFQGRAMQANIQANRALMLIRKFKKEEEVKINGDTDATMQIPIGGNWIVEGFGPYLALGNTYATRIGRKVTVQSLAIRYIVKLTAVEATGCSVRLAVLYDRNPDGANATSADVFNTDNQLNSHYNTRQEYRGRFQILLDKTISFGTNALQRSGKSFFKGPMAVKFNENNNGNVTDLSKGNFLFMAMAEGNAAAINVDYGFIFRFTDA